MFESDTPEPGPDFASEYIARKIPVEAAQFRLIPSHLRIYYFTVAGLTLDQIVITKQALLSAFGLADGHKCFERLMAELPLGASGNLPPDLHAEIIYRTNIMVAYSHARVEAGLDSGLAEDLPGCELMVVLDERTSAICRPLYRMWVPRELILTGPFVPPFHYNCRTTIVWVNAIEWERQLRFWPEGTITRDYWEKQHPKNRPIEGFGYYMHRGWKPSDSSPRQTAS